MFLEVPTSGECRLSVLDFCTRIIWHRNKKYERHSTVDPNGFETGIQLRGAEVRKSNSEGLQLCIRNIFLVLNLFLCPQYCEAEMQTKITHAHLSTYLIKLKPILPRETVSVISTPYIFLTRITLENYSFVCV
jgi:hypothetical protein